MIVNEVDRSEIRDTMTIISMSYNEFDKSNDKNE